MEEMIHEVPFLKVLIHDERGIVYEGTAKAVSSTNAQGPFDILLEHTNFITLIQDKVEVLTENDEKKTYDVAGGILQCFTSKVEIYLGVKNRRYENDSITLQK